MNLQELIATHKGDRSYREVAKLCGNNPTAGRLQQMAAGDLKEWPKPDTVRNLAKGLRVTEVTVVLAAAESLGLDVARASTRLDEYLPAGVEHLTGDQLRALGALVHSIVKERTTEGGVGNEPQPRTEPEKPTPMNQAGTPPATPIDPQTGEPYDLDLWARMRRAVETAAGPADNPDPELQVGKTPEATVHQFPNREGLPENLDELAARTEGGEPAGVRRRREQDEAAEHGDDDEGE